MLLRSSSTPVLGSFLCPEIPNHETPAAAAAKHHQPVAVYHNKVSFHPSPGSLHFSCNSSPISPSIADFDGKGGGFRRAQSEGNLEGLAYASCDVNEEFGDEVRVVKKVSGRQKCLMLQTIPSFSLFNSKARCEEEEDESGMEDEEEEEGEWYLNENEDPLRKLMDMNGGDELSVVNTEKMNLREGVRVMDRNWNLGLQRERGGFVDQEMFLAKGLGVDGGRGGSVGSNGGRHGGGRGGGDRFNPPGSGGDSGDNRGVEEHYKRMVEENPGDPLFLRNYAQFLYETKQDLHGAEEYYSRAILADPKDGEILSRYGKLVWELHHDEERASSYFERAVQASPQDSHVHAAYASFLWETEEDGDERSAPYKIESVSPGFHEQRQMHIPGMLNRD